MEEQHEERNYESQNSAEEEVEMDVRRGPWTVEEDFTLINYIAHHGEGRWNSLARCAGLKRTGKSCRLRWLNYLRPDVRRGNITLEEQLLILELHSRWGNRWSKIAQHLPGRTDNEIKNYWRTRVQKQAKQLKCEVNSKQFKDAMRYLWMPRLVERIQANNNNNNMGAPPPMLQNSSFGTLSHDLTPTTQNQDYYNPPSNHLELLEADHPNLTTPAPNYINLQGLDFLEQNTSQWMDTATADVSDNFWNNVDDIWLLNHQFNTHP